MKNGKVTLVLLVLSLTLAPAFSANDDGDGPEWDWFGSLRLRPEYNENLSDVFAGNDDKIAYASYRADIGARVDLDKDVTVLFDGQVLGLWGEDMTPLRGLTLDSSSAKFNLFNAWVEARNIFGTGFSARAGRQPLVYGDEWLLGDLDFYGGTAWDGIRGDFDRENGQTSVFWAKIAETNSPEAIAGTADVGGDSDLYGIWSGWNVGEKHSIEGGLVYLIDHRHQDLLSVVDMMTLLDAPYRDKRWTLTVRYHFGGESGGFFNGNAAIQWGRNLIADMDPMMMDILTKVDVDANAYEATGGYVWVRDGNPYKIWGRIANYTGDDASTTDNETFMPLFQDTHARYGYLDFWNGQWGFQPYLGGTPGFHAIQLGGQAQLPNGIRLTLVAERLARAEHFPGETNDNLGEEFGLSAAYDYGKNLTLELGVAQLYPGKALEFEPPFFGSSTARRLYVHTVVNF